MTFGEPDRGNHAWTLPEESSRPIIKRAIEGGINFFDTANSYSDGSSEEIVGRALRDFARRDDIVVATKVYYPVGDLPQGLSRAQILRSIDDSLRRLRRSTTSSKPVKHATSAHRRCTRRSSLRRWVCRRSTAGRALSPCRITTI